MNNMLLWKARRTVKSASFGILFATSLAMAFAYLPLSIKDGAGSAVEILIQTSSRISSLLVLVAGLYAAVSVTSDVQNRFLSSAIMIGNSILSIIMAEFLGYFLVIFSCVFIPSLLAFLTGCIRFGGCTGGLPAALQGILQCLVYALLAAAAFSITIPLCFAVKTEGMAYIVNLIALLALWSGTEALVGSNPDVIQVFPVRFFPYCQLFLFYAELPQGSGSARFFFGQIAFGLASAVFFAVILFFITYSIFTKMEKK